MSLPISDLVSTFRSRPFPFNPSGATAAAAVLLAACGQPKPDDATVTRSETAARAAAGEVECARGNAPLTKACTLERNTTASGLVLTISHPDGGFRRLLVTQDGRGVVAADGAEAAQVSIVGQSEIDVAIGQDHFRLPATVAASAYRPS